MTDEYGHGCVGCHGSAEFAHAGRAAPARRAAGSRADFAHAMLRDVDTGAWDGPGAMSKCAGSDDPASCYNAICAGKKDGDPALQSSHALPHHTHPGAPPNHNGVANALARLDSTEGLTNKAAAKAHLEAHMSAINGSGSNMAGQPNELRAAAYAGERRGRTMEAARSEQFRAWFKRESITGPSGKAMEQLDGYASVTGIEYDMYDFFGIYYESIDPAAFDRTLAANPDVAFLLNHKGMTMARTNAGSPNSPTLFLDADPRGLHIRAYLNPDRHDVHDLLIAIDDENVTEMSFAFMIDDGEWDEEYMHFKILGVDIDRGDVSAVNYGANPYTSIGARSREVLADVTHLPRGAQMAAYERLGVLLGQTTVIDLGEHARSAPEPPVPSQADDGSGLGVGAAATREQPMGRSIGFIESLLELDA